jgi:uncharacterized protein (TIGR03085 family)
MLVDSRPAPPSATVGTLRGVGGPVFDDVEREQLCELLDEVGPDAPTLLDPWTTWDLAAHLVLREHDNLAAPGLAVPGPWARLAERHRLELRRRPYAELVETARTRRRGYFSLGWVRRFPNLNELFVHHEDVRRARGLGPRELPPDEDAALFDNVRRSAWFLARRLRGVGLELAWTGTDRLVRARRGAPAARLSGAPGELLLYLFGRRAAAEVELTGPPDAVAAVERTELGM